MTFGILTSLPVSPMIRTVEYFYEELGRRVREAREAAGLTQEELAQRVELSRASVANIERGNQRVALHKFVELAQALGVEPLRLLPRPAGRAARFGRVVRQAGVSSEIAQWGSRAVERLETGEKDDEANQPRADG